MLQIPLLENRNLETSLFEIILNLKHLMWFTILC